MNKEPDSGLSGESSQVRQSECQRALIAMWSKVTHAHIVQRLARKVSHFPEERNVPFQQQLINSPSDTSVRLSLRRCQRGRSRLCGGTSPTVGGAG